MSEFLRLADVLAIHADQIERYGGSHGVRDPGQLESALYRPQSGYYGSVIEEAAALWESLAQNHPFVDGNKRTAFASTYTFLKINGYELRADPHAAFRFIAGAHEGGTFAFDSLKVWLEQHVYPDGIEPPSARPPGTRT